MQNNDYVILNAKHQFALPNLKRFAKGLWSLFYIEASTFFWCFWAHQAIESNTHAHQRNIWDCIYFPLKGNPSLPFQICPDDTFQFRLIKSNLFQWHLLLLLWTMTCIHACMYKITLSNCVEKADISLMERWIAKKKWNNYYKQPVFYIVSTNAVVSLSLCNEIYGHWRLIALLSLHCTDSLKVTQEHSHFIQSHHFKCSLLGGKIKTKMTSLILVVPHQCCWLKMYPNPNLDND